VSTKSLIPEMVKRSLSLVSSRLSDQVSTPTIAAALAPANGVIARYIR
jgi:hypothetical protein